ncbi:MAG: hypothetical protein ACQEQS_01320 [Thermodesulfobacteriota bacterium]
MLGFSKEKISKEIYIYGKHKSFQDFLRISDNRFCIEEIESLFENNFFSDIKDSFTRSASFLIFEKNKSFITGNVSCSRDKSSRKSPFFIGMRTTKYKYNKSKALSYFYKVTDYMSKIKSCNFKNFDELKKYSDFIKYYQPDLDVLQPGSKDFDENIMETIRLEKKITFKDGKFTNPEELLKKLKYIPDSVSNEIYSVFIIKHKDFVSLTAFFKKINKNEIKNILSN